MGKRLLIVVTGILAAAVAVSSSRKYFATVYVFLQMVGQSLLDPVVEGERRVCHPVIVNFRRPAAHAWR